MKTILKLLLITLFFSSCNLIDTQNAVEYNDNIIDQVDSTIESMDSLVSGLDIIDQNAISIKYENAIKKVKNTLSLANKMESFRDNPDFKNALIDLLNEFSVPFKYLAFYD